MFIRVGLLISVLLFAQTVSAATLLWDRNVESDMKDYQVYACYTLNCTVVKEPAMLVATVLQTPVGTVPSMVMDVAGKEGQVAITSRDFGLSESGLTVSVPFDYKAPSIPANPRFQ